MSKQEGREEGSEGIRRTDWLTEGWGGRVGCWRAARATRHVEHAARWAKLGAAISRGHGVYSVGASFLALASLY